MAVYPVTPPEPAAPVVAVPAPTPVPTPDAVALSASPPYLNPAIPIIAAVAAFFPIPAAAYGLPTAPAVPPVAPVSPYTRVARIDPNV